MSNGTTTLRTWLDSGAGFVRAGGRAGAAALERVPRVISVVAAALVVALVVALVALWPGNDRTRVTAHFPRAVGLYPGSEVRILGIPVGEILEVTPAGQTVTVVFEYDSEYDVPADAKAAVVSPSVVSDRYVQLLPVYSGGPTLETGDDIPVERTAVPVELDRIYQSLDDVMVALGPEGANSDGALSRLLETGAANLGGQGEELNQTTRELSLALETLAGGDDDLFGTVENLQTFTSTLARDDQQVRSLNANLASVADQLEGEREDLALALRNLAVALQEVSTFVQENRQVLGDDLAALEEVTGSLASQQAAMAETLDNAPVALSNLQNAYHPESGTLDTRNNMDQLSNPAAFLCSLVSGAVSNATPNDGSLCNQMLPLLAPVLSGQADVSGLPIGQLHSRTPSQPPLRTGGGDPTLAGILEKEAP